jgi:uncharacterized Fe-S cluster-containing radical SAM superfamily protein
MVKIARSVTHLLLLSENKKMGKKEKTRKKKIKRKEKRGENYFSGSLGLRAVGYRLSLYLCCCCWQFINNHLPPSRRIFTDVIKRDEIIRCNRFHLKLLNSS